MAKQDETITEISAKGRPFLRSVRELFAYRELIFMFVKRDFTAVYKQTILGPLWFVLQPLLSTAIFSIVFGNIAQISTEGVPHILFYLSGLVCWNYFSTTLSKVSDTFTGNIGMFSKVYFPRLTIPISIAITNLITLGIQFALFLVALAALVYNSAYPVRINQLALLFPLLVIQMVLLSVGCGIILASLTTKYRDFSYLIGFGIQLWMYATPVVYPSSLVPSRYKWLIDINPMSSIIDTLRFGFLGTGNFDLYALGRSFTVSVLVLFLGMVFFNRIEKSFVDTV